MKTMDLYGRTWFVRPWDGAGCEDHPNFDRSCGECCDEEARGTADEGVIYENWGSDQYGIEDLALRTVIDCGANIGAFALRALHEGAEQVVCFEPEPENISLFKANCAEEIDIGRIVLNERAVWSESDLTVGLVVAKGASAVDEMGSIQVPTICLDDVLSPFPTVDLLKMDMEGGEVEAICACDVENLRRVRNLAMEYHGHREPWGLMLRVLLSVFDLTLIGDDASSYSGGLLFGRNRRV